jgi:hypothetical protein
VWSILLLRFLLNTYHPLYVHPSGRVAAVPVPVEVAVEEVAVADTLAVGVVVGVGVGVGVAVGVDIAVGLEVAPPT